MKAISLFETMITDKDQFLTAKAGKEFENRIQVYLDNIGYNRLLRQDISKQDFAQLKSHWNAKWGADTLINPTQYKRHYVYQPSGSQNYPDFTILEGKSGINIETKFSKSGAKPVWNSGLPRPNGIYVYASYKHKDLVFFLGQDIVSAEEARKLHEFFDYGLKEYQREVNQHDLRNQKYGFEVYIRKAFNQSRQHNPQAILNFFTDPNRNKNQQNVLEYLKLI